MQNGVFMDLGPILPSALTQKAIGKRMAIHFALGSLPLLSPFFVAPLVSQAIPPEPAEQLVLPERADPAKLNPEWPEFCDFENWSYSDCFYQNQ